MLPFGPVRSYCQGEDGQMCQDQCFEGLLRLGGNLLLNSSLKCYTGPKLILRGVEAFRGEGEEKQGQRKCALYCHIVL